MTNSRMLALIRLVHTVIYVVMAVSTFMLLYYGVSGAQGPLLWVVVALLGVETIVFVGSGMKCPSTALAVKCGARKGYVFDTFLPERITKYTFRFFGTTMCVALVLLVLRWLGVIG